MLANSNFLTALEHNAVSPTGQQMCIYGDLTYPLRVNLMAPFRGAALTAQMEAFNDSMSNVRTSVEWLFGDIVEYFKFMDFKKNLKIGLSSIGNLYVVCALKKCVNLPLRKFNFKFFRAGSSHTGGILLLNNIKSSFHKQLTKN